jgi:uncharacterized protein YkwD
MKFNRNSIKNLDTARPSSFMTEREKDMIHEINIIRSNPIGYIKEIEKYIQQKEEEKKIWGEDWVKDEIETSYELIEELRTTKSVSILRPHKKLHSVGKKHGKEGKNKGNLTHQGSDGFWTWDRIKRKDSRLIFSGENIIGGIEKIKEVIISLLVDAGVEGRGHRKNILNPDWEFVACSDVGQITDIPDYWIQTFASPAKTVAKTKKVTKNESKPSPTPTNAKKENVDIPVVNTVVEAEILDTARNTDYMTEREKDMIHEINLIRSNPAGYIPIIEKYIKTRNKKKNLWGEAIIKEEVETARELIAELKTTAKLSILQPHKGVYTAAKLHGKEGKSKGNLGHKGSDGSWPWDRVIRQGLKDGNENLVGGPKNVRVSVILLLVDSGIPSRGHRKTLLNKSWLYTGCYEVGKVGSMLNYWVQKFGK